VLRRPATGEIINSPHHGGNPAFVISSANVVSEATLGHVKRLRKKSRLKSLTD
jgi:hypothetical protein